MKYPFKLLNDINLSIIMTSIHTTIAISISMGLTNLMIPIYNLHKVIFLSFKLSSTNHTSGRTGGRTDERTDGRMDGQMDKSFPHLHTHLSVMPRGEWGIIKVHRNLSTLLSTMHINQHYRHT